jgi:hypothetical protein
MSVDTDLARDDRAQSARPRWRRWALGGAGLLALALGGAWGLRERIAADAIDRELAALGLPAHYRIVSIGLGREVLGAVVVGDPAHPDLTVERVEVVLRYGLAGPVIDRITLVRPRLAGRLVDGQLHFGALDRLIYTTAPGPLRLPDWTLALVDARGQIDSTYGALGFSADGQGNLFNGFAGTMGLVVPQARLSATCGAARTTLFAHLSTRNGRPHAEGPLRLGAAHCGAMHMAGGEVDLAAAGDAALADWTIDSRLALGRIAQGTGLALAGLGGAAGLHWQVGQGDLSGRVTLDAHGLMNSAVRLGHARFDGVVHARQGFAVIDWRGDLNGDELARGPATLAALDRARAASAGTPVAPLFAQITAALARQEPGSRLAGSVGWHQDARGWRLAVPGLALRGGHGGQTLAHLDQFAVVGGDGHLPRVSGNFGTGGPDLPAIAGTMTAKGLTGARFRLAMAPYAAGGAQLAMPQATLAQTADGALDFSGAMALSGPMDGGRIDGLVLPVEGGLTSDGRLALWRHCVTPSYARLRSGTTDLAPGRVTLCPAGGAVLRSGARGISVAATLPAFGLHGRSGTAPFAFHAGAARVAWPGTTTLGAVDLALGEGADANRVHLAGATIVADPATLGGRFSGGEVAMAALPATVHAADGDWHFDQGRLTLSGGQFTLTDRASPARFAPVAAQEATLTLADQALSANLRLIAPRFGSELARVAVQHDLASGKGHADVTIAALAFHNPTGKPGGKDSPSPLQPADLSMLAKGVIANAEGTIRGNARFAWDTTAKDGGLTGSGRFGSDDFDFAAAVGPVDGLSGTIEFTDLIHLVSAPHQILKVGSINPGIEVDNGVIDLQLLPDQVVRLNRAAWPFEGGTLHLQPTELHMAVVEPRRFTLLIDGLEAGRFLQHINMSNLSATGTFDGHLPLVFDGNGGRIVGGQLVSRAPGGNVSYVGALSYRDLSPMANYAFKMLRSVDYRAMTIGMEGDLAGEVVTKVSFGGISQGAGAQRNLITRQIARLPIRFDINVRTQFYQLISSLRSLYDPSMVRDPRDLGLVDAQGRPIHHHGSVTVGPISPAVPGGPVVQPQASGTLP